MHYELIKLDQFSGSKATIYSILPKGESLSLFEEFIEENVSDYSAEIKQIMSRLIQIGKVTGFRDHYFKEEGDSNFVYRHGKSFWALFDDEEKN